MILAVFAGMIMVLVSIFLYYAWGYFLLRQPMSIEVTDKKIQETTTEKCLFRENRYATCGQYVTITHTHHIVITPREEFGINETLYKQVEVGRYYQVVVTGWKDSETLRSIIEIVK